MNNKIAIHFLFKLYFTKTIDNNKLKKKTSTIA